MPAQFQLPLVPAYDSVAAFIEPLNDALRHPPDDGFVDEYCRIRAILRSHPLLKGQLPEFLESSKTVADYRSYMQDRYAKEFEWNAHSANTLAQLQTQVQAGAALDAYEIDRELG